METCDLQLEREREINVSPRLKSNRIVNKTANTALVSQYEVLEDGAKGERGFSTATESRDE